MRWSVGRPRRGSSSRTSTCVPLANRSALRGTIQEGANTWKLATYGKWCHDRFEHYLGNRILEVPENPEFTERMRSPRSGFIAYVPPGSVAKGEVLVSKGGGKTVQCGICHGADLQGMANVPGIADRPVSYLVRQLFDMKQGSRQTTLMKPAVANLTEDDMIAIGAYLGSR